MHNTNKIFPRSDNSNMVIVTLQKSLKIKKMPTAKEDLAHGVLQNKTNKKQDAATVMSVIIPRWAMSKGG